MFNFFKNKKEVRWDDVANFQIDKPSAVKKFTDKLFEEYAWNPMFSTSVIEEYKKFMFLIATNPGQSFTPSKYVDRVWHLHLQYTKNYWKEFCVLLGREIHHNPGDGTPVKEEQFKKDYAKTLDTYERVFGHPAPDNIWGKRPKIEEDKSNLKEKTALASLFPLFLLSAGGFITIVLLLLGIVGVGLIVASIFSAYSERKKKKQTTKYDPYSSSYYKSSQVKSSSKSSNSDGGDSGFISSCSSSPHSSCSSHSSSFGGGDSDGGGSSGSSCSSDGGGSSCGSSCGGSCGGGD